MSLLSQPASAETFLLLTGLESEISAQCCVVFDTKQVVSAKCAPLKKMLLKVLLSLPLHHINREV
jgi:hypothetical protein